MFYTTYKQNVFGIDMVIIVPTDIISPKDVRPPRETLPTWKWDIFL